MQSWRCVGWPALLLRSIRRSLCPWGRWQEHPPPCQWGPVLWFQSGVARAAQRTECSHLQQEFFKNFLNFLVCFIAIVILHFYLNELNMTKSKSKYRTLQAGMHLSPQTPLKKNKNQKKTAFTWHDNVSQEAALQVNVWAEDWLEEALMHSIMESSQFRFKENLRGPRWTRGKQEVGLRGVCSKKRQLAFPAMFICAAPARPVSIVLKCPVSILISFKNPIEWTTCPIQ